MKYETYSHKEVEESILKFWDKNKVTQKLRDRNHEGKKFYFLDGPPYTSGRIHLGHAWNKALKDMVLRYKRMQGFNVWDRAGFDMHGLPTEHKVMAKFDLNNKDDIVKFGLDKFAKECRKFCTEMMQAMIKDFVRIGTTLDYSDPYQPISTRYTNAVWGLIKKAHGDNRLYLGKRTLHWDPKDQSALAKHELFYKTVTDESIYVKFKVEGKDNQYLVVWTTTPWTIPYDLFVMAHPKIKYAKVKVQNESGKDEVWIMANSRVKDVMHLADLEYEITETFLGKKLGGLRYTHFWNNEIAELKKLYDENKNVHTVLLNAQFVNDDDGTGLVHGAPGCGPEDYEVGYQNKIPPFNNLDESGIFPKETGKFAGLRARYDDLKFIQAIDNEGALAAKKKYNHDYPHAERSKEPVIFRTTPQWFLKVEDLKEKMIKDNEKVYWFPEKGKNAFRSWLENLRDNSITKQRFWGTPAPIWKSKDGDIIVIGSIAELEKLSKNKLPKDLHKPWIDEIVLEKNGKEYHRLPDVMDVWIDPGCASWICLYHPEKKDLFKDYFPADFILEGKDQVRAWFNLLFVCSYLYLDKPSFENVYMHGFITDVEGVKMSKSLGNIISPDELIDKHGADVLRYYCIQTNAGEDMNFSWQENITKERYLHIIWNIHKLLINLSKENKKNPFAVKSSPGIEERYIISKLNSTIKQVTKLMDSYRLDEVISPLENLFLELSRTYVQMVREKSSLGSMKDKETCMATIATTLLESLKMFQVIAPFVTEAIYLNLKDEFKLESESLSHYTWPKFDNKLIDESLEMQMSITKDIIAAALGAREKAQLGLRWPVKELIVETSSSDVKTAVKNLKEIILTQTNCKEIRVVSSLEGVRVKVSPNYGKIGPVFGDLSPEIIKKLASTDSEEIMTSLEKENKFSFTVNKKKVNITSEMLEVEREVPDNFKNGDTKFGVVYISTLRNASLDAEGYVRELTRHIQSLRKKEGLEKSDRVNLKLDVSSMLCDAVKKFEKEVLEKVGAKSLKFDSVSGEEVKIKKEKFKVSFDMV